MEEKYLTVKEVAGLKRCGERNIQLLIKQKKLSVIEVSGLSTGQGGIQYRIPLSGLDDKLQLKYKKLERKREKEVQAANAAAGLDCISAGVSGSPAGEADGVSGASGNTVFTDLETLTASEREEISFWKQLIDEWHLYRETSGMSKGESDAAFIRLYNAKQSQISLTRGTLYRKWNALRDNGEAALIDRRGKHGAHSKKLTAEIWDIFEAFYLDESRKSVTLCVSLTELQLEALVKEGVIYEMPELPTVTTFNREVKKIPIPYIEYFRHGRTHFIGKCVPYIKRMYDLEPNDIWVADNHTFDVMLFDGQKPVRLYLTAFMDVRTRKLMGWCVTDRPCADATIFALRKGIEKHGIPKMIYTDNGREFLSHDFGGNGFRKKKARPEEITPPSILKDLGIEFRTALPMNARAKGVERMFKTVKETFSKLFEAYTGGSVAEKPERLKKVVKVPEKLKGVEKFLNYVDMYIEGIYNKKPHRGEGMEGMSPNEAFEELLTEKRVATEAQLNVMFMRWSNMMKIGKNGITLTFFGKKLQYFDKDLWVQYFGRNVYVRYNPEDLTEVRVYDTDERFICTAKLKEELSYSATADEIAKNEKLNRAAVKEVSAYLAGKAINNKDALELMMDKAAENIHADADKTVKETKIVRPLFDSGANKEVYAKAVGSDLETSEEINWTAALDRLQSLKNNGKDDV